MRSDLPDLMRSRARASAARRGVSPTLVGVCARPAPVASGLVRWLEGAHLRLRVEEHAEHEASLLLGRGPEIVVATEDVALRTVLPALAGAQMVAGTRVLVLAADLTPRREAALLALGATGAADIDAGRAPVMRLVTDTLAGRPVASPAAVRILGAGGARPGSVTPRQRQILALLAHGLSTAEVAETLCIAQSTVKTHVARLGERLGVPGRRALSQAAPAILGDPLQVRTLALAQAAATRSPVHGGNLPC